jgi:endonuclease V-like protein UPF0215 family
MINSEVPQVNDVSQISQPLVELADSKPPQKEIFRTKRSYIPVEVEKRQKLIQLVEEDGLTIKEAAQNLKINYSTAKHIVKVFKRTGEVQTQIGKRLPDKDVHQLECFAFSQNTLPFQE